MIATTLFLYHRPSLNIPGAIRNSLFWQYFNQVVSAASAFHKTEQEIDREYEIIQQCQNNPKYFAAIYERYYESIFIYINKRVDNEEMTADITAKVFLQCLKNINKYKYQGVPFSAWLFKIAINEINQFFRKKKNQERIISLSDYHVNILIDEIHEVPEIDTNVLISTLLEQLTDSEVQFLELRFFENRAFKEIGYILGISETYAKIKTYRIIKKLRTIASGIQLH